MKVVVLGGIFAQFRHRDARNLPLNRGNGIRCADAFDLVRDGIVRD